MADRHLETSTPSFPRLVCVVVAANSFALAWLSSLATPSTRASTLARLATWSSDLDSTLSSTPFSLSRLSSSWLKLCGLAGSTCKELDPPPPSPVYQSAGDPQYLGVLQLLAPGDHVC